MTATKLKAFGLALFIFLFYVFGNIPIYYFCQKIVLSFQGTFPSDVAAMHLFFLLAFLILPFFTFISGFLYCLVFREDISPEFSENVTKYFIMFSSLALLIFLILGNVVIFGVYGSVIELMPIFYFNLAFIITLTAIMLIWYFGTYLTLIYSGRFYNFLKNLVVKK